MRNKYFLYLCLLFICGVPLAGCVGGVTPSSGRGAQADISEASVHEYLERLGLGKTEIVRSVTFQLQQGKVYRKRVQDQKNHWTLLSVWLDPERQNTLRIVTKRDETCPTCGGSGNRKWSSGWMGKFPGNTRCLTCQGKGILPNKTTEYRFSLGTEDYKNREAARQSIEANAYKNAPADTARYVTMLGGEDAAKRLAACLWLDKNYIKDGDFFQNYLPMLRKARWIETSKDGKTRVWQFWAGRNVPGEERRAYYRVYADMKKGKIRSKGFYPKK